jgi:hypothetical protein
VETIILKNSIIKYLTYTLGNLMFLVVSLFFFYFPDQPVYNFLGAIGAIFFGFMTLVYLIHLLDRQPRLIIDGDGINDRLLKTGVIDWYDIENIYLQKIGNSRFVCLILKDEDKYLLRNHRENKKFSAIRNHYGLETFNVNIDGLTIEDEELIGILKAEISRHETPPKPVSLFDLDDNEAAD